MEYEWTKWSDGNLYGFANGEVHILYDLKRTKRALAKIPQFAHIDHPLNLSSKTAERTSHPQSHRGVNKSMEIATLVLYVVLSCFCIWAGVKYW